MDEVGGWLAAAAAVLAVGVGADRLLRAYLAQRTLLQLERQRAKREAKQRKGLVRLVGDRGATVRIIERDADGFRMIEVEDPERIDRRAA
jgi:hypothetical protein